METAIRWSPSSTTRDQRFLYVDVTGKSFKLCQVTSFDGKGLEYDVLSTHVRVPGFRAFDWSTADESLIAVGQSSGEVNILRMEGDSNESWSFPIRNQRYCNAVAFSSHGLLAGGLDKVRNDVCLNVWDVNHRIMTGNSRGGLAQDRQGAEPLRKLSSDPITSIKFFRNQPDTLVAGVKGQFLKLFDLRDNSSQAFLSFSTRCVHNTAIDWLDENYFASCSSTSDPIVCIWDRRMGQRLTPGPSSAEAGQIGSSLELKNTINGGSIWSLRFSKTKRGSLGLLSSNGQFKMFDIAKEYSSEEGRHAADETLGEGSSANYPEHIYTKNVRDIRHPFDHRTRGYNKSDRVVSFDFLNMSRSNEPSALTLLGNGNVEIVTVQSTAPPIRLSSQNVLVRGSSQGDHDFQALSPRPQHAEISNTIASLRSESQDTLKQEEQGEEESETKCLSSRENREHTLFLGSNGTRLRVEDALTCLTVNQARCKEGYLFNYEKNQKIVADDPDLQEFWTWVRHSRDASANKLMVVNRFDMSYLGVCDVWFGEIGMVNTKNRKLSKAGLDPDQMIKDLVQQLELPEGKRCETEFWEHRQLGLHICGAIETQEDLVAIVDKLVDERQHTKAAALALFQNEAQIAFHALRRNEPTQGHKLLAMAIVGGAKGHHTDPDWEETCREIATELTDPYGRAILALVSKASWESVLAETTLPLKYRVEVALRWLGDEDLTDYLRETKTEAIQQGDIEGIVLTGLRHSAIDLFQSYIRKFNDVQTAVLAMSHTVPRFIDDEPNKAKFRAWRETYRRQINSWKLQLERARFDVGSRKFAVTWDGRRLIAPAPQQVSLTCNYCTRPLSQVDPVSSSTSAAHSTTPSVASDLPPSTGSTTTSFSYQGAQGPILMSGTVCPRCFRHMPRCGVCSLWLGSPDPMSRAAIAADAKEEEKNNTTFNGGDGSNKKPKKPSEDDIVRRFVVFCINCNHGFHANHAKAWFTRHRVCPIVDCACICDR
ncbi:hypothetical protein BGW36DRAFT_399655 [Talaromyces proteolyticus]|uniref:Uncharacterized protein n=1 Tax=Talaromyces proteolyticus TaxID=1131652 RepID=A0AAD4KP47_9EURO|nr:uncharacterized protein BGW36DRAFT_399655 [Talaromyces proteolyticus]KAH8692886.1 hypothetical protein BGW36DRAFT_399655 [Talaromyces proteolyticus]